MMRVGIGYDVHPLVGGRKLILGGVEVPYGMGLLGHSDADVLIHAVCDALLGAIAAGDIGTLFPDNSPEFLNISSLKLLEKVYEMVRERGYVIENLDSTVVAQNPRLYPYVGKMVEVLSGALEIPVHCVNVKAKTTEGLGFAGRGEGIAAYAVVMVTERRGVEKIVWP